MNWRRAVKAREQRTVSTLELFVGVTSYAQRLQTAAKTLIDYFTPRGAEEIAAGHRRENRGHWLARHHATTSEAKRIHLRGLQKAARRTRARCEHHR